MKTVMCRVLSVDLNTEFYDDEPISLFNPPSPGNIVQVAREDWYPFEVGGKDGEGSMPQKPIPDKNGELCGKWIYYTHLEQISQQK
jgi:hypothetical protein